MRVGVDESSTLKKESKKSSRSSGATSLGGGLIGVCGVGQCCVVVLWGVQTRQPSSITTTTTHSHVQGAEQEVQRALAQERAVQLLDGEEAVVEGRVGRGGVEPIPPQARNVDGARRIVPSCAGGSGVLPREGPEGVDDKRGGVGGVVAQLVEELHAAVFGLYWLIEECKWLWFWSDRTLGWCIG